MDSNIKYAGFWRRFVGWLIDFLILIIISHWVTIFASSLISSPIPDSLTITSITSAVLGTAAVIVVIDFIVMVAYYLLEATPLQATIGKYIAGIRITDERGSRISYGKAVLRRVYSLLSIVIIFIGYIVAAFTPRKQTIHDMLAKTVVTVNRQRKGVTLVGIVTLTIILGIFADHYLGAGFHVSINTPGSHYDTHNGLQNYIVQKGSEVDPTTKATIINAFDKRKALFARNKLSEIKQYFLNKGDPAITKQVNAMSDSDLQKLANIFNQFQSVTTDAMLNSPDASWVFSKDMKGVEIRMDLPTGNPDGFNYVKIDMLNVNGQWY